MPESNTQTNNPLDPVSDPEPDPLSVDVALNHPLAISAGKVGEIVRQILRDHRWTSAEISVAIVNDETIQSLNREYLCHDYATDVLSFVLECDENSRTLAGEVVVSADTAIAASRDESVEPGDELLLYLIHGTLHLVGFDDKNSINRLEMRRAEKHYTTLFEIKYSQPDEPESDCEAN